MPATFTIRFEPAGVETLTDGGLDLLALARASGVPMEAACGGQGSCRSCSVRIAQGPAPAPTATDLKNFSPEELAAGWRQACQARPVGPCSVQVPAKASHHAASAGQEGGLAQVPIKAPVLNPTGQPGFWRRGRHTVGPVPAEHALGLAVDLGTTNLAAALVDMVTGKVLAAESRLNPQVRFGADVISRLMYAMQGPEAALELQSAAVATINELAAALTRGQAQSIAELTVVGNTVMQHFLLGLPVASLTKAPYAPATLDRVDLEAAGLGLELAPGARIYCPPNIAGFVGGDHVAALTELLAVAPEGRWLMLDIGTNTEIALGAQGRITSVSCASGPAFEGGKLTCGMRAAPGAVQTLAFNGTGLTLTTIDDQPACGICGSGVIATMAALRNAGVTDARGRLALGRPEIRERGGTRELVLADEPDGSTLPVVFTQQDVRNVQLAKAAIRTGLDLLLAHAGLAEEAIDLLIVAGAFGKFIDLEDAITIGLLPRLPASRMMQVGNAAAGGAKRMLVCNAARAEAEGIARRVSYLELAAHPGFQRAFIARSML